MPELHTDEGLLRALRAASTREMTAEELHKQRVSFIMASVDEDSGITRAQVEQVLARQEGAKG
ncbi:MAG: hypothetical protein ACRYGP_28415 [Janthinobacterium lividum]